MKQFLLEQLNKLEALEKRADRAEQDYINNPMDEAKEHLFDKWYEREYNQYILLSEAIVNFTNGEIDFNTAKKMVKSERTKLRQILA